MKETDRKILEQTLVYHLRRQRLKLQRDRATVKPSTIRTGKYSTLAKKKNPGELTEGLHPILGNVKVGEEQADGVAIDGQEGRTSKGAWNDAWELVVIVLNRFLMRKK